MGALRGEPEGRPAVLCPGGMMSLAVTEVMDAEGVGWPQAHGGAEAMLRLALAMQEATGFDNLALPFCMTVEAAAYGAAVDMGDAVTQPRVKGFLMSPDGAGKLPTPEFASGRAGAVLSCLKRAGELRPDLALMGNLVGPLSLLGMLADPLQVLRWTRKRPATMHGHLGRITGDLIAFGRLQAEAGADAICIADPTATGEILGAERFRAFALPYLNRIARALRSGRASARAGAAPYVIIHICGDVTAIESALFELEADAVSFDSMADVISLCRKGPPWRVMGNLDAFLLRAGPAEAVARRCRSLLRGGVRLLAPACGVIPTTPLAHLRAMAQSARHEARN
ncbi:MAG: uroporphyrinogen decarboxylase family protein [Planctomycetota bacterium]